MRAALFVLFPAAVVVAQTAGLGSCPGYKATNVKTSKSGLTADLNLAGTACNAYGSDISKLKLIADYENEFRIHVKIVDAASKRYEVPEPVLPRPASKNVSKATADIQFNYTASPFSFSIFRTKSQEVLFSTNGPLVFEPQYLRLATNLPENANIYGLGEHTNSFRHPTSNFTRTLWSRDAYGVPPDTNLYGNHPIYFEHRSTGTHGVFMLNSNGMDIKRNDTLLEYNMIGGVIDMYFLAGSTSDPTEVSRQYADVVGLPAEMPYWGFGLHQCRYGYTDFLDVAGVIANYSDAGIPLETMWTDIDYMYKRWTFTNDPDYFPTARLRQIIDYLHTHDQQYIMMVDPAVAYQPNKSYGAFDRGIEMDVFLKNKNGSNYLGLVWPGVTVYPDWFHPKAEQYWTGEFRHFFNASSGINIDGAWIDMNEPASFCDYPCSDPFAEAVTQGLPPNRSTPAPAPDAPLPIGQNSTSTRQVALAVRQASNTSATNSSGIDLINPPYAIANAAGNLSSRTAHTDTVHANGLFEYDTHNIFGTMMSAMTRAALLARRPGLRPIVITRSTFAGAGAKVGKWLGDNLSDWDHYRNSISGILGMASIYQIPMVGADICGFGLNTTETLCARWATLGAFYPFMRNHNQDGSISQEFYRWPSVTAAAKNALDIRYRLLDYFYTAFHHAHMDGTPVLNPLFYKYPKDNATFGIDMQFLFGPSILVSPVTDENVTSVNIYLPDDVFYDFKTLAPVRGNATNITLDNVDYTDIPVHIRGGAILPLRVNGSMTTNELRQTDFELVVAPGKDGSASGSLYADDGVSITQKKTTLVTMDYSKGKLSVSGKFGFPLGVDFARVRFAGLANASKSAKLNGKALAKNSIVFDSANQVATFTVKQPATKGFTLELA